MYSYSPSLSQISLKNSFGKVVFQNLAKIEMTRNKNRLFGRHFETVQHLIFFFFLPRVETRGIIEARDSAPVTETKSM